MRLHEGFGYVTTDDEHECRKPNDPRHPHSWLDTRQQRLAHRGQRSSPSSEELAHSGAGTSRRSPHQTAGVVVDHDHQILVSLLVAESHRSRSSSARRSGHGRRRLLPTHQGDDEPTVRHATCINWVRASRRGRGASPTRLRSGTYDRELSHHDHLTGTLTERSGTPPAHPLRRIGPSTRQQDTLSLDSCIGIVSGDGVKPCPLPLPRCPTRTSSSS